jgi:hypothetical protein
MPRCPEEVLHIADFCAKCLNELAQYRAGELALTQGHLAKLLRVENILLAAENMVTLDKLHEPFLNSLPDAPHRRSPHD